MFNSENLPLFRKGTVYVNRSLWKLAQAIQEQSVKGMHA